MLERQGDRISAAELYQQAIATEHPRAKPWADNNYGYILHAEGNTAGAARHYRSAIAQTTNKDAAAQARINLEALEARGASSH